MDDRNRESKKNKNHCIEEDASAVASSTSASEEEGKNADAADKSENADAAANGKNADAAEEGEIADAAEEGEIADAAEECEKAETRAKDKNADTTANAAIADATEEGQKTDSDGNVGKIHTVIATVDPGSSKEELLSALYPFGQMIEKSGVVAFPTETVYGLGASALDPVGIEKIFIAKGRPSDNPLIVHITKTEEVFELVRSVPEKAMKLMKAFWPGPLTMIFKKQKIIPDIVTAGGDTVAIRMPDHPVAKALIEISGVPLVAPSANASGKPSPTMARHVLEDLEGKIHGIIDGGSSAVGIESTVIDMTGEPPMLLRPGGITQKMIEAVIGPIERDDQLDEIDRGKSSKKKLNFSGKVRSPGMKYTHYAPKAQVLILRGIREKVIGKIKELEKAYQKSGQTVGIITVDENLKEYEKGSCKNPYLRSLGSEKDVEKMAANLFAILRDFDQTDVKIILAEALEDREMGYAIMNRLSKAAGQNILYVEEEN